MIWEAANVKHDPLTQSEGSRNKPSETVEAALSRLTRAYNVAMTCVGALHRAHSMALQSALHPETQQELHRVAMAARTTLEQIILIDPLIADQYGSTWLQTVRDLANKNYHTFGFAIETRPKAANVKSSSHQTTVREIAYLALINYADLLMACQSQAPKQNPLQEQQPQVLDQGVVTPLSLIQWESEDNVQLALVALCDASDLDDSDPVMWLKLACAARALSKQSTPPYLFQRLERHALERGSIALPDHLPPNRLISKALQETQNVPDVYPDLIAPRPQTNKLVLDLPRYSWSILGRLLIRACCMGILDNETNVLGAPLIVMTISPMLVLPPTALATICTFLENKSIWRFEATCRGLSASIVSARTSLERRETMKTLSIIHNSDQGRLEPDEHEMTDQEPVMNPSPVRANEAQTVANERARARSSKRVQSQLITSGKRAERESKRKSVKFCLLASVLNCTGDSDVYRNMLSQPLDWDTLGGFVPSRTNEESGKQTHKVGDSRQQAEERLGDSCLTAFINHWSESNSGPFDVLEVFVSHVAMNASEVFSSDASDSMILSNMFLECIALLSQRSGHGNKLDQCWLGPPIRGSTTLAERVRYLSVNLLNAELRLRRCEDNDFEVTDFDCDANVTTLLLPALLCGVSLTVLDKSCKISNALIAIKARCHWFAAGYYLWRSRTSYCVRDSKEAESLALEQIDQVLASICRPSSSPAANISTPHLTSPRRSDAVWRNLSESELHRFRDEIQAAAVVSNARQRFQEKVETISALWETLDSQPLQVEDLTGLSDIGKELSERYDLSLTSARTRFEELIDDFLITCNHELVVFLHKDHQAVSCRSYWGNLWDLIPLGTPGIAGLTNISHPSILTIFCSCLQAAPGGTSLVLTILTRVIQILLQQQALLLSKLSHLDVKRRGLANAELSDDDSISDNGLDCGDLSSGIHHRNTDENKILLIGVLVDFVMHKIADYYQNNLVEDGTKNMTMSHELSLAVHLALGFVADWYTRLFNNRTLAQHLSLDAKLFFRIHSLVEAYRGSFCAGNTSSLDKVYFTGMVRVIITQQSAISVLLQLSKGNRMGRAVRQRACMTRANLISIVGAEIGRLLSLSPITIVGSKITHCGLLVSLADRETPHGEEVSGFHSSLIVSFVESLLWLWSSVVGSDPSLGGATSLERMIAEELSTPLAVIITSLCGAGLSIVTHKPEGLDTGEIMQNQLCLREFFDSDASINEYDSDKGDGCALTGHSTVLQCVSQAVQCIAVVFARVNERTLLSFEPKFDCGQEHGMLLPLVVTRVLSSLADLLLVECSNDKSRSSLWAEEYPFGTRTTGLLLDATLHKAYRLLYGFTISSSSKESSHTSDDQLSTKSRPECPDAAAQLYRCILRTYKNSRKSPPKSALECVASSLPPVVETLSIQSVRNFVFFANKESFLSCDVRDVVSKAKGWTSLFDELNSSLHNYSKESEDHNQDDMMKVRRGIYRELAKGPLPPLSSGTVDSSHKGEESNTDERFVAAQNEQSLSRKFHCILDDLSFGHTANAEGWAGAAQCLQLKANLIADRIGYSKGFSRSLNFIVPTNQESSEESLTLPELLKRQEQDYCFKKKGWVPFIGNDLSLFVDYSWTSFKSLTTCFQNLSPKESDPLELQVLLQLKKLIENSDFVAWQQALGGMFVEGLRRMATKCLLTALFVLDFKSNHVPDDEVLKSEIFESLGTLQYSQLMGNQVYGYPMQVLTDFKKRDISNTARLCFETALVTVNSTGDADDESQITWDLQFMIGKCHEKTATTYRNEKFAAICKDSVGENSMRVYEHHFGLALKSYATSLKESQAQERGGGSDIHAGGSSHGATEVIYRLHASRLKCLLSGAQRNEQERTLAEVEALKLTECFWFDIPDVEPCTDLRKRVWKVIADVVSALSQCRIKQPFFHRSVYRYAQALMWAPVFDNPETGYGPGSLGTVPATKSYLIRGLNNATPCANSAEVIMACLFERKRQQLCAVWVTNAPTSPSPFELLNNTIRKYDSVRGKYISAYIDSLRICQRTSELENFQQWITFCKADLPSFYQASALSGGALPNAHHNRDSLLIKGQSLEPLTFLRTVKRLTNRALVDSISKEFNSIANKESLELFKRSYACFLRVNCTVHDLEKTRDWKFSRSSIPEVEILCQIYQSRRDAKKMTSQTNDWSGGGSKSATLEAALDKCRELFPMLSTTVYSKRKKKINTTQLIADDSSVKRSSLSDEETKHFVVDVPRGLDVGEKFQTTIQIGNQLKTIRLTVPTGNPEKLKFSMKVPNAGGGEKGPSGKRLKTEESEQPY